MYASGRQHVDQVWSTAKYIYVKLADYDVDKLALYFHSLALLPSLFSDL